ncbi:MAG: baseplate J/gp47 family protein [Alsobacter sp.]
MADISLEYLAALPTPEVLETYSFETILARRKAEMASRAPAYGFAYDVGGLESDPGVVLLEEASYEEILLRERGNSIARARYLYFARGSEIDHLGAFYDVTRMAGESDDRLKQRIILAIMGRSTGGTEPRYRAVAMGASIRVTDAKVYTEGTDPTVHVAVFAADNNGVADDALLQQVRDAVTAPDVRMVNDTIGVRSAVVQVVNVVVNMTLLRDTSSSILAQLAADLPAQWVRESGLGRDLTHDWLKSKLVVPGVYKATVVNPAADVVMPPYAAVRIGTVALNLTGRDF